MPQVELSSIDSAPSGGEDRADPTVPAARPRRRGRAVGIALVLLAVAVAATVLPVWARYLAFGPALSRLSPAEHPWYFPVLMLHVISASVAYTTCVLQVWPWLRRRHPRVHRSVGRVYIFAGVYPAGCTVLLMTVVWPFSAVTSFGHILVSLLWLSVTTYGFVLARRRWSADHRRWMLRSFALTASVLANQLVSIPVEMLLRTQLHTRLAGSEDVLTQVSRATENWLGFVLAFIAVEWWLEREQLRRSARRRQLRQPAEPRGSSMVDAQQDAYLPS